MKTELVVFDLAGTTVNDNKDVHRVLKHVLAKNEIEISIDDANEVMGIPKPVAIRQLLLRFYEGPMETTDAWIDEMHREFIAEMVHFYETSPTVSEKTGASDLFRKLKANNIKVAVDTGFDRLITAPLLQRMGWGNLIDCSVTSDEVMLGRPYPDLILRAMSLTGVTDPEKVAKVGDTASDMQEGYAAGCGLVIGITSGAFSKERLEKEKHTHLIQNLDEIPAILNLS